MAKKLVLSFDGTWNEPNVDRDTNVWKFHQSIIGDEHMDPQTGVSDGQPAGSPAAQTIKWYDSGVGTVWYERIPGGFFGFGLSRNIRQGYQFLIDKYEDGDEIYLLGFSRGAYTARSLSGLIRKIGLLRKEQAPAADPDENPIVVEGYNLYRDRDETPDSDSAKEFRTKHSPRAVKIKFLGVWDTVGSVGVPVDFLDMLNDRYEFHDVKLSSIIENAFHAMAIDEHRKIFHATLWDSEPKQNQKVEQVWFVGAHSDVGGGSNRPSLSDVALRWMQDKAEWVGNGLRFDDSQKPEVDRSYLNVKPSDPYGNAVFGLYRFIGFFTGGRNYRPIKKTGYGNESVHETATAKINRDRNYHPKNPGL